MRVINSARNAAAGMVQWGIQMALNFIVRTVFIHTLSEGYLGIGGLFSSILTVLSLADLGVSSAVTYALYKPMAEKNIEKVKSLLWYFRRVYRIIGFVFFGLGLAVMPFLPYLAKGATDLVNLRFVFLLYLLEISASYWFFGYLSILPATDQRDYKLAPTRYAASIMSGVIRIVLLLVLRGVPAVSYYVYTSFGIVSSVLVNLLIRHKVMKLYPWARDLTAPPLPHEEKQALRKNMVGVTTNKVCAILNDGIDSTIVSALIGVAANGIFSNYLFIRTYLNKLLSLLFSGMHASIGELCAVESREKKESFFRSLQLMYFWIYGFCAICLWTLYDAFIIGVWLHDPKWKISGIAVFLLGFNFLIEGIAGAVVKYRDVHGMYWQTKYRYMVSSVLNAVLSVILVGPAKLGVAGALLGTMVSLVIMLSFDPVLVYREVFGKKAWAFYRMYFGYLALALATAALVYVLCRPFAAYTVLNFIWRLLICLVVPNGLWYILFRKRPEAQYLWNSARYVLDKFFKRSRGIPQK